MKVALLGAAGTIAAAIISDLAASVEIDTILLLDLDGDRASAIGEAHGGGKTTARVANAHEHLAAHLEEVDLLINAAAYRTNVDAMKAALDAGCHYIDLGGLYWMTERQQELDDDFKGAGLLALLGIGSSPGKTNVMAAHGVAMLEGADRISIAAASRDLKRAAALSVPYSLQTLMDEMTMTPVVLRDGRATEINPLAPGGQVDFGEPIGVQQTIYTLHSEILTFGTSFGCRQAGFRLSLPQKLESGLRGLIGASAVDVASFGQSMAAPSEQTVSVHRVDVHGKNGSVTLRAITRSYAPFAIGGSIISSSAPAAAAARMFARGEITARGALPPELCIDPETFFNEVRQRGCEFSVVRS